MVANADELKAALADSTVSTIVLAANGEFGTIVAKSNKTIIALDGAKVNTVNLNAAENLTLKNITFDAANADVAVDGKGNGKQWALIYSGDKNTNPNKGARNIVIDGCTFTGAFANGGAIIAFTDQNRGSGQSGNVTVKNCTFEVSNVYYEVYCHYSGYGKFNIENNVFNCVRSTDGGLPIYLGRYQSSTPVVVKGNAFKTVSSLEKAVAIQAHSSSYNVSVDASDNTFAL